MRVEHQWQRAYSTRLRHAVPDAAPRSVGYGSR